MLGQPFNSFFVRSVCCLTIASAFITGLATTNAGTCFVWKITNVSQPFYLVGTMHALSSHDYPLPRGYDQALRDSKQLIFEIKPDRQSDFSKQLARASVYPKGDGVQRHVHPKTWEIIKVNFGAQNMLGRSARIGDVHLDQGIQQLRPWAIAYAFYGIRGYNDVHSSLGVDNHLWYQGKRMHKEFAGLETDAEHVEVLGGMDDIESELILLEAIVNRDKQKAYREEERAAWKRGDIAGVWASVARDRKLNPGASARLLDLRNVKWVPRINAEIKSGKPTSIVVGCAHMLGPNGLLALLERNGHKFEQL